jgi:hypothetical protein
MRACNGCRKRKIKCDAATTNTWPCSACLRLKLVCVPPAIGQDGEYLGPDQGNEADLGGYLDVSKQGDSLPHGLSIQPEFVDGNPQATDGMAPYGPVYSSYIPQTHHGLFEAHNPQIAVSHHSFQEPMYQTGAPQPLPTADSGVFVDPEQSTAEGLSEALGELKIDETGIGEHLTSPS